MRLVTFEHDHRAVVGVVDGDEIVAHAQAESVAGVLEAGPGGLGPAGERFALDAVRLLAPVPRPGKILAVARNYAEHAAELDPALGGVSPGRARGFPVVFNKQTTAVCGPFDPIVMPAVSVEVDYEGELAVVIGKRAASVPDHEAWGHVGGFTVADDVSVRDWQRSSPTLTLGKSFDTHCPFGPWVVTPDEADPPGMRIRTHVNGELRQDASCTDMIFGVAELVSYISVATTLEPGDLILTGTPAGVAAAEDPPRWLRAGDVVRVEIDRVGAIENPVVHPRTVGS